MRHELFPVICVLSTLFLTGGATLAQGGDELLERAKEQRSKGRYEKALGLCDQAGERGATREEVVLCRARSLNGMQEHDQAFAELRDLLAATPGHFEALRYRGDLYQAYRMYERAEQDHAAAAEHAPNDSLAHLMRCDVAWDQTQLRRFDEARAGYLEVLAADSNNVHALNGMGVLLYEQGDTLGSLEYIGRYVELKPEDRAAHINMGFFLSRSGRYEEALVQFNKAEEIAGADDDAVFLNNRGYARLMTGDLKGAQADIERSLKLDIGNSYAHRNQGLLLLEQGDTDGACTSFEKALRLGFTNQYGNEVDRLHRQHCRH